MTVGGQSFDLSAGGLFLVRARQAPPAVVQVAADLAGVAPDPTAEDLLRAAGADPRVASFYESCRGGE